MLIFGVLSSSTALDFIAKKALFQSGLDIKYDSLKGDLFEGLKLKGVDYKGKAKADLELKADFKALGEKVLHIQKFKVTNINIKRGFLESLLDRNQSKKESKSDAKFPFKEIVIDKAQIGVDKLFFKEYEIDSLNLFVKDLRLNENDLSALVDFNLKSNISDLKGDIKIVKNLYEGAFLINAKKDFLNDSLKDQNISFKKSVTGDLNIKGDLQKSDFSIKTDEFELKYQKYILNPKTFTTKGDFNLKSKDLNLQSGLKFDSNIASGVIENRLFLNIDDINNTLKYDLDAKITALKKEFEKILRDENLSLTNPSKIDLKAVGDLKKADVKIFLEDGEIKYQKFILNPKNVDIKSVYEIKKSRLRLNLNANIDSNAAYLGLKLSSYVDLNDINHTLKVDINGDLLPKKEFFAENLSENNITISKMPKIHIESKTKNKKLKAVISANEGDFEIDKLKIKPQIAKAVLDYDLKTGDLNAKIFSKLFSNAGDLNLDANASLNIADIDSSLKYTLKGGVKAKESFLKTSLESKDVSFKNLSPVVLNINGDSNKLAGNLFLSGEAKIKEYLIKPDIKRADFVYEIKEHKLKAHIKALLKSTPLDLNIDTDIEADVDDLNNTLKYRAEIFLRQKRELMDINLKELGKIALNAKGSLKELNANLTSKKIKFKIKSDDFNRFDLFLDTKRVHIDKIYKNVPLKLKNSFIALTAQGFYARDKNAADIFAKIKSLKVQNRYVKTSRFHFTLDNEDFKLSSFDLKAKGFLLTLNAASKDGKITANINNKALKADVKFSKKPLFADAKVDIPSISNLFQEIDKVYPLEDVPKVKGALKLVAKSISKEKIKLEILSPKIALKEGRFEKIDILAFFEPTVAKIERFDFNLKGFEPKKMNRHIGLKRPAVFTFKADNADADIEFENFFSFKGSKRGDLIIGDLKCKNLYLGAKGYGKTKLSADIQMFQSNKQLAVSGDIKLKESEFVYESRVLDVSKDPDIIIIDKSKKKKRLADDSFVQNTFLDLHIKSEDEIEYKMEAGTIILKPDIEVRKDFGQSVKILGKINILDGEYDFGDKRFKLKEGAIAFRGLKEINPLLDLHVEYDIDDILIFIDILGDKRKPKLLFKSKPMMSKKDIFSYLLFGFAVSESDGAQSSAANAAEKIFGRALAKDLARELKLDRLDLTREEGGGVNIKAGKKINKKTIIYYQNKSQESSVIAERKLGKHFLLDTQVGQSSQAVDLIYKRGYK